MIRAAPAASSISRPLRGLIDRIEVLARTPERALRVGCHWRCRQHHHEAGSRQSHRPASASRAAATARSTPPVPSRIDGPLVLCGWRQRFTLGRLLALRLSHRPAGRSHEHQWRSGGRLEADGYARFGGFAASAYDPGNGFRIDAAITSVHSNAQYDGAFGAFRTRRPSPPHLHASLGEGRTRYLRQPPDPFAPAVRQPHGSRIPRCLARPRRRRAASDQPLADRFQRRAARRGVSGDIAARLLRLAGRRCALEREFADSFSTPILPVATGKARTLAPSRTRARFSPCGNGQ